MSGINKTKRKDVERRKICEKWEIYLWRTKELNRKRESRRMTEERERARVIYWGQERDREKKMSLSESY